MLPAEVRETLTIKLGSIKSFSPVSGGCINNGGKLTTGHGQYFLKWNDAKKFPGMFEAEARGLQLLYETKCIRVPSQVSHGTAGAHQFILMEFISRSRASLNYWEELGRGLASLHRNTAADFGLDHDNYIGSLPQRNAKSASWHEFFVHQRLEPQLTMLDASSQLRKKFNELLKRVSQIFPPERPALLHGDLWNGNLIISSGAPCLIDPAVYYGNREMELAFTQLFGGFDQRFYDTYKEVFPLQPGFQERAEVCNLYPLLVHANLFGGHYILEIEDILSRWA